MAKKTQSRLVAVSTIVLLLIMVLFVAGPRDSTYLVLVLAGVVAIVLDLAALVRVSDSDSHDVAKPLWAALIILAPIMGAIACFIILPYNWGYRTKPQAIGADKSAVS